VGPHGGKRKGVLPNKNHFEKKGQGKGGGPPSSWAVSSFLQKQGEKLLPVREYWWSKRRGRGKKPTTKGPGEGASAAARRIGNGQKKSPSRRQKGVTWEKKEEAKK